MHEQHKKTIDNLKRQLEPQSDILACFIIGSVARDEARTDSDVDFYLVIDNKRYEEFVKKNETIIEAHHCCVPPCSEANGYYSSKASLLRICDAGREIDRWTFIKTKMVFSRDPEIEKILIGIPLYPEKDRLRRMESYHSQIYYHFSFFEFAYYSQTKYLIYETAVKMILSAGRLILADNRILYPNRKWFFRELQKAPDKPAELCDVMNAFLNHPTIESGNKLIKLIQLYKSYPVPAEGMKSRISRESNLNLEEW
jgi:hypothetical protein